MRLGLLRQLCYHARAYKLIEIHFVNDKGETEELDVATSVELTFLSGHVYKLTLDEYNALDDAAFAYAAREEFFH